MSFKFFMGKVELWGLKPSCSPPDCNLASCPRKFSEMGKKLWEIDGKEMAKKFLAGKNGRNEFLLEKFLVAKFLPNCFSPKKNFQAKIFSRQNFFPAKVFPGSFSRQ